VDGTIEPQRPALPIGHYAGTIRLLATPPESLARSTTEHVAKAPELLAQALNIVPVQRRGDVRDPTLAASERPGGGVIGEQQLDYLSEVAGDAGHNRPLEHRQSPTRSRPAHSSIV